MCSSLSSLNHYPLRWFDLMLSSEFYWDFYGSLDQICQEVRDSTINKMLWPPESNFSMSIYKDQIWPEVSRSDTSRVQQHENSYTSCYTHKLPKISFILPDHSDLLLCCLHKSLKSGWSFIFVLVTKEPHFSYSEITAVRKNQWFFAVYSGGRFCVNSHPVAFVWILIPLHFEATLCTTVLRLWLLKWQIKLVLWLDILLYSYLIF